MSNSRACIFCHQVFMVESAGPVDCPGCGTELPDESYTISRARGEQIEEPIVGAPSPAPRLTVTATSPSVKYFGPHSETVLETAEDPHLAPILGATVLDRTSDMTEGTDPTGGRFYAEAETTGAANLDLDALAAVAPDEDNEPTGVHTQRWRCPRCLGEWLGETSTDCPACGRLQSTSG